MSAALAPKWWCFFFFQAEDGIRDFHVTGVQTVCSSDLFTNFGNDSYVKYFNIQNGEEMLSPLRSNDFEYTERNMAAYVGLTKNITDKLTTKVGLRYEHLSATGESPESIDKVKKNYGSWFPTFYIDSLVSH